MAIMKCKCKHEGQDRIHGKGERVHNEATTGFRCTVCERVIPFTGGKKKHA